MAYAVDEKKKEEEASATANATSDVPKLVGETTSATGGIGNMLANTTKPEVGTFTNINKYLEANKPQAASLANRIGGVISTEKQNTQNAMDTLGNEFGNKVQKNTKVISDPLKEKIASEDYSGIAANQDLANQFKNNYGEKGGVAYKGPYTLESASDIYNPFEQKYKETKALGDMVDTAEGRQGLLGRLNTSGLKSRGINTLNASLLQDQDAQNILQGYKTGLSDLDTKLAALREVSQAKAKQAAETSAATQKQMQDQYSPEAQAKIQKDRLSQAQKDQELAIEKELSRGGNGYGWRGYNMSNTGFTADPYAYLIGDTANMNNAATANDYARFAALNSILGNNYTTLNPNYAGQAGTYGRSAGFNEGAMKSARQASLDAWNAAHPAPTPAPPPNLGNDRIVTPASAPAPKRQVPKSSGGTVICTELHRQGYFDDATLKLDTEFGIHIRNIAPEIYEGYMAWAPYVVRAMKKSKFVTKIVAPFGKAWANKMAGKETLLGSIVLKIGMITCGFIGKLIHKDIKQEA